MCAFIQTGSRIGSDFAETLTVLSPSWGVVGSQGPAAIVSRLES